MRIRRALSFFLFVTVFFSTVIAAATEVPDSAKGAGALQNGDAHVEVTLLIDHAEVQRGDRFRVGILFDLDVDWHIYWENPGDAGLPTEIEWHGEGLEFGPLQWAAPGVYLEDDGRLITFGYDSQVVLYSEVLVGEEVSDTVEISAEVQYLACHGACLPGEHSLHRQLQVGSQTQPAAKEVVDLFDRYSLQLPKDAETLGIETSAALDEEHGVLEVILCPGPGADCAEEMELLYDPLSYTFVATSESEFQPKVLSVEPHPGVYKGWLVRLDPTVDLATEAPLLAGVLRFETGDDAILPVQIETVLGDSVDAFLKEDHSGGEGGAHHLLYVLLLAFLGGMILNLMPCVFPVLAIKAASFADLAHKDRSRILAHGVAYTGGITASLLLLGALVVGLQLAGTQVGWGFQFQQPLFLAGLALVIVLFGLNSFGLFEISLGANKLVKQADETSGMKRSFAEGILTVVLATPCSAPFLGTAMGFALASNGPTIMLIFFVLGLGLAFPFVALTLIPGASRFLPRPGAWMSHLKILLGFILMGVAIWLVWLVGRLAGVDAMGRLLVLLAAISVSAWIYGLVQFRPWTRPKELAIASIFAILIGATYFAFPLEDDSATSQVGANSGPIDWQTWDKDAIADELEQGRKVFVNFTADWCITCKANERHAINSRQVVDAIRSENVAMFKADWTRPDEEIREELAIHQKGGVPMYLYYSPEAPDSPQVLPELLTPGLLTDHFQSP